VKWIFQLYFITNAVCKGIQLGLMLSLHFLGPHHTTPRVLKYLLDFGSFGSHMSISRKHLYFSIINYSSMTVFVFGLGLHRFCLAIK